MKVIAKKHTGWLIVAGVLVLGGIFALYKFLKKPKGADKNDYTNKPVLQTTSTALNTSSFPLKNGSRGDLVKQLQGYLGVTVDGIFGPKTQAALQSLTGKPTVDSQAELNSIIMTATQAAATSSAVARANTLTSTWNSGAGQLMAITNVTAYGYVQDAYGALNPTGKNVQLSANTALSRSDYVPVGSTQNGYLMFQITNGALAGSYRVDPTKITVTNASAANSVLSGIGSVLASLGL